MADVWVKMKGEDEPRSILNGVRAIEDVPAEKLIVYDGTGTVIAKIDIRNVDSYWPEA